MLGAGYIGKIGGFTGGIDGYPTATAENPSQEGLTPRNEYIDEYILVAQSAPPAPPPASTTEYKLLSKKLFLEKIAGVSVPSDLQYDKSALKVKIDDPGT